VLVVQLGGQEPQECEKQSLCTMDEEGYPDADPISLFEKKSIFDSSNGLDYQDDGLSFKGFDKKEGKEEENGHEDTALEMDELKQGLNFEENGQKKVNEEEENYDGDGSEKAEGNKEDFSYLADLEARAYVKFNQYVFSLM
jgi:hypothetical protein